MALRIVIVGGVAGGASAAARARRLGEDASIVMFERGPHVSFANCGLPYFIGGEIADQNKLLVQTPQSLHARFNLDVRTRTEVTRIDRERRVVVARNLDTDETDEQPYDALILSTGASPLVPPIPGIKREGHFTLRNIEDMQRIDAWIKEKGAKRAVVAGGGYIGLEMAEQLKRRGLDVALAEAMDQVMAPLDAEMAAMLHTELRKHNIDLHLSDPVARFDDPSEAEPALASIVELKSGIRLPADLLILGLGVRAENKLAVDAGLKVGERGGVQVDQTMRTSDRHIYAIGDMVEVRDRVTGEPAMIPLAGPANRQGRIAADDIFGIASTYKGTLGTAVLRLFDLTAAVTGASERTLKRVGKACQSVHLHPSSHAGYYPGAKPIALKLIFALDTGRILGAQAIGEDGVDKRIDVIATAIASQMTVDDLAELELAYAPPFGSAKDPVNLAGMVAQNVLAGELHIIHHDELAPLDPNAFILLDVRTEGERAKGAIPDSQHIPLDDLRGRLDELPRDKTIVAYCQSGQRSYYACRILSQHGFDCKSLTGSYKTWAAAQGTA